MDYNIIETRHFGIEADSPEEALKKHLIEGGTPITLNVQAAPRPPRGGGIPVSPLLSPEQLTAVEKLEEQKAKKNADAK